MYVFVFFFKKKALIALIIVEPDSMFSVLSPPVDSDLDNNSLLVEAMGLFVLPSEKTVVIAGSMETAEVWAKSQDSQKYTPRH